jgi:oligopeptide/dipeptide ABC transporter ATP-binding protein
MEAFPPLGGDRRRLEGIPGQPPDLRQLPVGCSFAPRCARVIPGTCNVVDPPTVGRDDGHMVVCHLYSEKEAKVG